MLKQRCSVNMMLDKVYEVSDRGLIQITFVSKESTAHCWWLGRSYDLNTMTDAE